MKGKIKNVKPPAEQPSTTRKQLIALLADSPLSAHEISQCLGVQEKEVAFHLDHIEKSLRRQGASLIISPACCLKCGFVFTERKRHTSPGRCPKCKATHVSSPLFSVTFKM